MIVSSIPGRNALFSLLRLVVILACGASIATTSADTTTASAEDRSVQIEPGLSGKLMMPEKMNGSSRAVLLLHGWNGEMDEVGNLYHDLANELANRGIASLRFNFSGEGMRAKYVVTSTHESRTNEASAAYNYLKHQLPRATIGVNGFSLGGLTAMTIATDNPSWFKSMVLWSAAESMRVDGNKKYSDAARLAMKNGRSVYSDWTDITLTRAFLASYVGVQAGLNLAKYPGAFLTIRGDQDYLPSHDREWLKRVPTLDKSFLLIGGAGHIYNVLDEPKPAYGKKVIKATVDWFDRTLTAHSSSRH